MSQPDPPARSLPEPLPPVLIVTAGGLEQGGGIGRVIGYMLAGWRGLADAPAWRIVDSRGPRVDLKAPFRFLASFGALLAQARRRPITHIHVAGRGSTIRKALLVAWARLLGLPIVLHLHDFNYRRYCEGLPAWGLRRVRAMFQRADLVVVLGRDDAALVQTVLGVEADRIAIMPNAVTGPDPAPGPRSGDGSVEILFLGRLSERKGVPDLIEALARPELAALPWQATLAGDGDLPRYRAQVAAAGLAGRIDCPGWLDRAGTERLLRGADILVLPSYDEGMAMSVLEGLAYGLCVVCTPVGALAEVVEDEVSGVLVQPGDVAGLAAALAAAIRDPERRRRLGAGGRALFLQGYEAGAYARRMLALYRTALVRHGQRSR